MAIDTSKMEDDNGETAKGNRNALDSHFPHYPIPNPLFVGLLILLLLMFFGRGESACPASPTPTVVDNKKLYFHSNQITWNDARTACPAGTTLAVFANFHEFAVVKSKRSFAKTNTEI